VAEWTVNIGDDVLRMLAEDFRRGPIIDDQGRRLLEEQTVDHLNGLRIEVFADEHPPPHFRVSYQGESDTFDICTGAPVAGEALKRWRKNIRKWHAANRGRLIEAWNRLRPSDCPVGPVSC